MSVPHNRQVSRRDFLRGVGLGSTALATACLLDGNVGLVYASAGSTEGCNGVLIDLTRCGGCESCALACKESNGLPHPETMPDNLSSDAYTYIEKHEVTCVGNEQKAVYAKRQCMHCIHPACVSACTVGALRKEPDGPVVYDGEKCIGCRYCQYACPFGIPTYQWDDPLGLIGKCQFCVGRLREGQEPACVEACPNGALRFGRREELLAQSHAQIASAPERYVDHVYGEYEAGGTSMLYLSPVPFEQLGFPTLGSQAIPHNAEAIMKRTPLVAATVASVAVGLHWVLKQRDQKLARAQVTFKHPGGEK